MTGKTIRRGAAILLATSVLAAIGGGITGSPALAQVIAQTFNFNIPTKPVRQAMNDIVRVTGIDVVFEETPTASLPGNPVRGALTPQQAVATLLSGTGLSYRFTGSNAVTIFTPARPGGAVAADGSTVLQTIEVEGKGENAWGPVDGYVARQTGTATKTDTPIIETPQTINVVSADQIEAQGATSVDEALRYTPGVATDFYGAATYNDYLRLRGFEAPIFSEGMRMPSGLRDYARLRHEPYGLERVEVLKGPSSVLYGQAAPGGMVNAVHKRPTAETIREVELHGGSFDRIQGAFDFGGAIDAEKTFLYRLTGLARDSSTQVDEISDDRVFIAPSLTWQPNTDTKLTVYGHYQHDVGGNSPLPALGTVYPTQFGYLPVDAFLGYPDFNRYKRDQFSLGYEFEHRFNDVFKARHKLEYSSIEMDYRYSVLGGLQTDPVTGAISLNRSIQHTHDTATSLTSDSNLQADFETGPLAHKLLLGLDHTRLSFDSYWGGDFTAGRVDVFNPHHTNRPPNPTLFPDQDGVQHQTGIYLQDQIKWDNWVLSLGGRYDWAKSTVHNSNNGITTEQKDGAFTGRAGLVYLFDNGIAPYVSYATSFEPTPGADANDDPFKPRTAEQFEAGVRYQPEGWDAYIGISAYQLTQSNVLTQDPNPPVTNPWAQVQTGEVRVRGIEVEGKANLAAGLDLVASYAYQDSKITRTNTAAQLGNRFQLTPVHQAALWANYTVQSGALEGLGVGGGLRHVGSRFGDLNNLIELPSFTLFDAALSYDFGKKNPSLEGLTLRVNANNLFDKRYVTSCASLTSGNCYYGEGRSVTASLKYKW